ncbi:hypothetical protein PT974_10886 [Cladobotryum mycophilum]|uniref:Uncharacterized protein n=1 Tax=Cladobotryum mycophilum TaxID=491253 RepID=A0ABR0SB26_9HYPO
MKFAAALITTLAGSAAASFCTPLNGCKYDAGKPLAIQSDSEFVWKPDGRTGFVGKEGCSPTAFTMKLPPNEDLNGGKFGWSCLYIQAGY